VGSIEKRLEALEVLAKLAPGEATPRRSEARARMKAVLDEIAAARREGRAPHEEAADVMEAIERSRAHES
jgi:cytochrome P450